MTSDTFLIVAAYNEADCIASTLAALDRAFPGAPVWVADDGSTDDTAAIAQAAGARVVRSERMIGKGAAVTLAARVALQSIAAERPEREAGSREAGSPEAGSREAGSPEAGSREAGSREAGSRKACFPEAGSSWQASKVDRSDDEPIVLLCDGDLGGSAEQLAPLVESVVSGDADLAVAVFSRRVGGGLGLAVGFARWAVQRRCGLYLRAPISGQRALRASVLAQVLPFAPGFGMEIGMTIDATRVGARVREVELDLSHRATGRTLGGFIHRGRQLIDFVRVYLARR
jgi:glycosyltransferase involved in cell wall biosynthesis